MMYAIAQEIKVILFLSADVKHSLQQKEHRDILIFGRI